MCVCVCVCVCCVVLCCVVLCCVVCIHDWEDSVEKTFVEGLECTVREQSVSLYGQ